jgi:prepilin-type N-terminal cleavage/methylation domain-containing protein
MRRGFTLLEVIMALLVLEVAVVGAAGTLTLASRTLGQAERLERAVAQAEGVLDSLRGVSAPTDGAASYAGGEVRWTVPDTGWVVLTAFGPVDDTLFEIASALPRP